MRIFYFASILVLATILPGCSSDDPTDYVPIVDVPIPPVSPVIVDLTQVPYEKLSDYKFFDGPLKNQNPALDVLPFEPASGLFTDYALKKRFVWMPKNTKGTFNSDHTILELPVGAALIKNFYYNNVQNITPAGGTRIIETRIMIRKADGWIFANYVWNAEQTEAYYDLAGSFTPIAWTDANNNLKSTEYRVPSEEQCIVCHKTKKNIDGVDVTVFVPIGIEPQNLNFNYDYGAQTKNQLTAWVEAGYLEPGFSLPSAENSTVRYTDATKSLDLRVRSYVDINCAHCHQDNQHCDYRPLRFAFNDSKNNLTNMGVCVETVDMQEFEQALSTIVTPGNINRSMLYHRLNTTNEAYRMPLHGRSVIHEEGIALVEQWINSLQPCP